MVTVNTEETTPTEAPIKVETILRENATIKTEDISKARDRVQGEDNIKTEDKAEVEDNLKEEDNLREEAPIWVKFFAGDVTELVIMQQIVELLLRKFLSFIQTQLSLRMMKMILIVSNMFSQTQKQQLYRFQSFSAVIIKMHGFLI